MNSDENKIIFYEIKTYEDAYYYNTDPITRNISNKEEIKVEKKKSKSSGKLLEVIWEFIEGALEIIISLLD